MVETTTVKRAGIVLIGGLLAAGVALGLFGLVPVYTELGAVEVAFGLLLFVGLLILVGRIVSNAVTDYDVADVSIDGAITQRGDNPLPVPDSGSPVSAEAVVDQIENADEDEAVGVGARRVAYAVGAGLASVVADDGELEVRV